MATFLDLLEEEVRLTQVTSHEWAGPCPWCGGKDRFHVWANPDRYWCRKCHRKGDPILYLRDFVGMQFDRAKTAAADLEPIEAGRPSHQSPSSSRRKRQAQPQPSAAWRRKLNIAVRDAADAIWSPSGQPGYRYLRSRGFTKRTIRDFRLGFVAEGFHVGDIWVPPGITIPWHRNGKLIAVNVRRLDDESDRPRYRKVRGSKNSLFGIDRLEDDTDLPVMLVEGEFDAMSLQQAAGELLAPLATGSAVGGRIEKLIQVVGTRKKVLLAFDADEAGAAATCWWMEAIPHARDCKLSQGADCNSLLKKNSLARWVNDAMQNRCLSST